MHPAKHGTLRVYGDAIELVRRCRRHWEVIGRFHPELLKQLRRAVVAVPLNLTEGDGRFDGNGRQRLRTAMYEAKETRGALEIAAAAGFVSEASVADAMDLADKIAATLFKLVGRRWAGPAPRLARTASDRDARGPPRPWSGSFASSAGRG